MKKNSLQLKLVLSLSVLLFVLIFLRTIIMTFANVYLDNQLWIDICSGLATILIGSFVINFLIKYFVDRPLKKLTAIANQFNENNFTERVNLKTYDQFEVLGTTFNKLADNLQNLIREIQDTSTQLLSTSQELTANSEEVATSSEHVSTTIAKQVDTAEVQVQQIDESKKSIDELAGNIHAIAESNKKVDTLTDSTFEKAANGNKEIKSALQLMKGINESVENLSNALKKMIEDSNQIESIINVITGISKQTNLLALNAAIEAARAGEHGKGFAIVAEEVRKLAVETSNSAHQINELIQVTQSGSAELVNSMEASFNEVTSGMQKISTLQQTFEDIQRAVEELEAEIKTVSSKTYYIENDTGKVTKSAADIKDILTLSLQSTQEIASASEQQLASMKEVSASAGSLSKLADNLNLMILKFKV